MAKLKKQIDKTEQIKYANVEKHSINEQADPNRVGAKLKQILDSHATVDMDTLFKAIDEDIDEFYKDLYGASL
ncbi:MAG: hypothetical protein IJM59_00885 [Proteobacteria bacterium]|nr:hypothetical protein [Pseudomonadota bacterium]